MNTKLAAFAAGLGLVTALHGQAPSAPNPSQDVPAQLGAAPQPQAQVGGTTPIYRVNVVGRTIKAVNYRHRSGWTKVDFRGTALMPEARGEARAESKQGAVHIEAEMNHLQPATRFGPEYLTYVMWAISPEGRAENLGEVLLNDDMKSKLNVSTDLQAFGLIVTAEPYFGVTQPSDVVVMENVIRPDTKGRIEEVDAKYELLPRGQYVLNVNPSAIPNVALDKKTPLELYEARNAVQIARWSGADRYASETFQKAQTLLNQAEQYQAGKSGPKPVATTARAAVQTAEDARVIAIKRQHEEEIARERQAAADREAKARAQAEAAARDAQIAAAQRAQAEAEQQAEAERRARAEAERAAAEQAAQLAAQQRAEAEAARAQALAQQQAAQAEADRARQAAAEADRLRMQAENERREMRQQLLQQLNTVLATRETARGLIVNMSDVLFDSGQYTLRPGAREKLAKIAGIVLAHPGLKLDVEGHTDSIGGDDYNERLSERRANAVRDYLIRQGVPAASVTARGLGKAEPVASNASAAGRQQNRRVELVVSGDIIGTPPAATQTEPAPASQPR